MQIMQFNILDPGSITLCADEASLTCECIDYFVIYCLVGLTNHCGGHDQLKTDHVVGCLID